MIGLIATGLMKAGVAEKLSRGLAWAITAIAGILLLLFIVDAIGDSRETAIEKKRLEQTLENTGVADNADGGLEDRDDAVIDDLEDVIDDAADEDPEGAAAPVGPVSRDVHDSLRDTRRGQRRPASD